MRRRYLGILMALVALGDRLAKLWALGALKDAGAKTFWPGVADFRYALNTGAAFSLLAQHPEALAVATAILVLTVGVYAFASRKLSALCRVGLILVAAGGVGNLADRLLYGGVVDFIELTFVRFAIFNVADVSICLGALLTLFGMLTTGGYRRGKARVAR